LEHYFALSDYISFNKPHRTLKGTPWRGTSFPLCIIFSRRSTHRRSVYFFPAYSVVISVGIRIMTYAMKHPIHPFHVQSDHSGSSSPRRYHKRTGSNGSLKRSTKTVVVLGASYGGARAGRVLSQGLPEGWRVVVIDRNSHMNRTSCTSHSLM
jgi:chemotaxis response regulator CheB